MASLQVRMAVLGPVQTNVYFLINQDTAEAILTDPADDPSLLLEFIRREGLSLQAVLLTHGHFDHIGAVRELQDTYAKEGKQLQLYAHKAEFPLLADPKLNHSAVHGRSISLIPDQGLEDGQELMLAGFRICVIYTPGHTAGGACYYLPDEKLLIAGDTLFAESIGRSDLPTGDGEQLLRSVRERLFVLPDDTVVLPGHGPETSIGHEKQYNPFFRPYTRF